MIYEKHESQNLIFLENKFKWEMINYIVYKIYWSFLISCGEGTFGNHLFNLSSEKVDSNNETIKT